MSWTSKGESDFLDALYLGVRDRAGFDASLRSLGALFDVENCILLDFDSTRPEVSAQAAIGIISGATLERYRRDFAHLDPAPPAFMAQPAGTAIQTYRLLPDENRKPGIFFGEFFRPAGLEECLGGTLATHKGRFAMVGLHRPPDRRPFDDDCVMRLEKLMPHLARALRLRRSFIGLEGMTGALAELCDRLAAGVIALDEVGKCIFANWRARQMTSAGDGLAIERGGRPVAVNRDATRRLSELEADVRSGGAGGLLRVARASGRADYAITVAPFPVGQEGEHARLRGVIFIIHDPAMELRPDSELIASLFGLPAATARVVAALVEGNDPRDYAESAAISMSTVRYHLKLAFARTGTSRQSALVRLVIAALRDGQDHRVNRDDAYRGGQ